MIHNVFAFAGTAALTLILGTYLGTLDQVYDAWQRPRRAVLSLLRPRPVVIPAEDWDEAWPGVEAAVQRYSGPLAAPPEGIEVVKPGGVIHVGAHERTEPRAVPAYRAVERYRAPGDPWTGEMPKLTPEAEAELARANEERRVNWAVAQLYTYADPTGDDMREVIAGLRALPAGREPVYSEKCEAVVLAQEAAS